MKIDVKVPKSKGWDDKPDVRIKCDGCGRFIGKKTLEERGEDYLKKEKHYCPKCKTDERQNGQKKKTGKWAGLAKDQKEAAEEIDYFLSRSPNGDYFTLKGYAGTGKSYLITTYVKKFINQKRRRAVAVTAPTHKAVKVLKEMFKDDLSSDARKVNFCTIHSLLQLKEYITPAGEQHFKRQGEKPPNLSFYDLIIIDEGSMLSDDLMDEIKPYLEETKFLIVGDPAQIPPVGQDDSEPMEREDNEISLKTIKRQANESRVLEASTVLRKNLGKNVVDMEDYDGGDLRIITTGREDEAEELIDDLFVTEEFEKDPDHAKIIGWTNKSVDFMNEEVRKRIFNTSNLRRIELGERLVAREPIFSRFGGQMIAHTNEEIDVIDFSHDKTDLYGYTIGFYQTSVYCRDDGVKKEIDIIDGKSKWKFSKILAEMADEAKAEKDRKNRKALWKEFFRTREMFANVTYNYALTAHKSQGSTYRNVIVLESDIDNNPVSRERDRIKYTALTRCSHMLYLVR